MPNVITAGLAGVLYMLPLSTMLNNPPGRARIIMVTIAILIGLCGLTAFIGSFFSPPRTQLFSIYLIGCFLYTWLRIIIRRQI